MALAMQSLPSNVALKNTTAAILMTRVCMENARVQVAANEEQHIELVFDEDRKDQAMKRLDPEKEYG
jgi:hypothetical protein